MLLSELRIGEGYEVRDKRALIGTVKLVIHNGKMKLALDFPKNITLLKTQDAKGITDEQKRNLS